MKKKITLNIANPCSENYNDFKKTGSGGFCNSCKKNVIDFTKMNDTEIINYFKLEKETTCGRFRDSQLKSYSLTNENQVKKPYQQGIGILGFSLITLLSTNIINAQRTNDNTKDQVQQNETIKHQTNNSKTNNEKISVKGTVTDKETKEPLPGVSIILKNTNKGAVTDFDGNFTFPTPLIKGDTLVFHYLGFKSQELIVSGKELNVSLNIDLEMENTIIHVGEVSTNKIYSSKITSWDKFKNLFK